MTADKPQSPRSPAGSFSQAYASAFVYPGTTSPAKQPQGPRTQSIDSTSSPKATDPRDRPGSSRTRFSTPLPPISTSPISSVAPLRQSSVDADMSEPRPQTPRQMSPETAVAPYRSPEPVYDPPSDDPPGYVPGVVEEHYGGSEDGFQIETPPAAGSSPIVERDSKFDVTRWQADVGQDNTHQGMDTQQPERPQVGPGLMPRCVEDEIHGHPIWRISNLRVPPLKSQGSHPPTSSPLSPRSVGVDASVAPTTADSAATRLQPQQTGGSFHLEHIRSLKDVQDSLPGGSEGYMEWYFCWRCSAWYKVTLGTASIVDGEVKGSALDWDVPSSGDPADPSAVFNSFRGRSRLLDIEFSRTTPPVESHIHFHELRSSLTEPSAKTLERVDEGLEVDSFPHKELESEIKPSWYERVTPLRSARLFLCCSSSASVLVGAGPVAGQIPSELMRVFVAEKQSNPGPGVTGVKGAKEGVREAIQLLILLLGNPLFKGQRGWVKLDNKRFQRSIGTSIVSSLMLYMIGFGCRQEASALQVGPLTPGEGISEAQVLQQDRYMMRAWVELNIFLAGYIKLNDLEPLSEQDKVLDLAAFGPEIDEYTSARYLPIQKPMDTYLSNYTRTLGVTRHDSISTILAAYEQQKACDTENLPKYLGALDALSKSLPRAEELSYKLAFERSMGYYTDADVEKSYARIGYTSDYAQVICVEPDEAPDDEILKMHREASQRAFNQEERQEIASALVTIGRHRKNAMMVRFGESGQSLMTVDEAYAALSAPKDSIDDGLIMQYEMAVNEYPGRTEHYRSCLEIIAKQDDADRSGLKRYLETGSQEVQVIQRNDIPVGLENIGNTCYLNSVLQFLYCIKPLRSAVLSFEQDESISPTQVKPEVERAKEFVRHLRLLFLQLYKSETPAVRPDMELAYLAITVPQADQEFQQEIQQDVAAPGQGSSFLDSIPTVGSPSSTRVNTPDLSRPVSPAPRSVSPSRSSILGKRASQDRESNGSPKERPKRADTTGDEEMLSDKAADGVSEDFEIISKPVEPVHRDSVVSDTVTVTPADQELAPSSPESGYEMNGLKLKSPSVERSEPMTGGIHDQPRFDPPPGPPPLPPRPQNRRMSKAVLEKGLEFGKQQDSAEVLGNVLDQLESAFEPPVNADGSKGFNFITDLFSCMYRQQIVYHLPDGSQDAQAPVECRYSRPALNVMEEGKDLYDCLAELYLGGADIEYEGKKGHMMDLMDKFPPVLYIEMRRSQYEIDPVTGRAKAIKVNTHIPFAQTLAMDRFMVDVDGERRKTSIELTRQSMALRARLHTLRSQKPLPVRETFKHLHKSLLALKALDPDLDITDDFLAAVEPEADRVQQEMNALESSITSLRQKLDALWDDQAEYEYELVSVFMHRGRTSGAGHYWTYQSNLPRDRERFFKYNDEQVTEVPASEVLQDRTGSDANPALLCYVRKDQDLVETLHRELFEIEQIRREQELQEQTGAIAAPAAKQSDRPGSITAGPSTLQDVEMRDQEPQQTKPELEAQLIDIDMPDAVSNPTATESERPLIDFGESSSPVQTGAATEKEDDLMD